MLDLGRSREVRGLRYLARQDGGWNGAFGLTEVSVADDPDAFPEEPDLTVTFGKVRAAQSASLPRPRTGRYVRIRVLSEVGGGPWASAADLGVIGS